MNPLMPDPSAGAQQPPMGQPAAAQQPPPTPQQIDTAHEHIDVMSQALQQLVQMPKLSKEDVFKAAAQMIAKGVFPTQESRWSLVQELTQLPNDEAQIRPVLGQMLLHMAMMKNNLTDNHGGPSGGG